MSLNPFIITVLNFYLDLEFPLEIELNRPKVPMMWLLQPETDRYRFCL